jgi:outer membrane protein assembly factor BamE
MNKILILLLGSALLAGCGTWKNPVERITPHKIPVQQGNVVTQEMIDKLKPGMTQAQVRFVLGTPLVVEPFRNDRWDYVFLKDMGGKAVEKQRVTVLFEDGVVKGLEGDIKPAAPKPEAGK